ncbi:MAG: cytidylate kinase-like family protein [Clostridia bacterium]|nr:cytidylate kinase-like family protein [Clostridia bacterium]
MENKIITISREFGSGGRYIGRLVAEKLGIPFYDKELIAKVAAKSGLAEEFVEKKGEYSPSKSMFAYGFVVRNNMGESLEDYLHSIQRKIILELAEQESCVIIGRCADYILKDHPKRLNVFIYSTPEDKIQRIQEYLGGNSEAEAKRMMRDMDKKRSINYNYYTDRKWGDVRHYSMALNSGELGLDRCVDLIVNAAAEL